MANIVPLVLGLGLIAFGGIVIFRPASADDPYRERKFAFAKGSATQLVVGGVALLMGATQLLFWFRAHF